MPTPSMPKHRFTLVELFVVIAVVAILAATLQPALSNARPKSKSIACANNLKTLSTMLLLYVNENKGNFMPLREYNNNKGFFWHTTLVRSIYGKDSTYYDHDFMFCPEVQHPRNDPKTFGAYHDQYPGYGACMAGPMLNQFKRAENNIYRTFQLSAIRKPRITVLAGDSANPAFPRYGYCKIYNYGGGHTADSINPGKHGGDSENFAFVDGHVENIKVSRIWAWRDTPKYNDEIMHGEFTK